LFREGSDVKAGDSLFQIDARIYKAAAASAKEDLAVARQNVERYKPLLDINAVSKQEYDLAVAKVKQAEDASTRANEDLSYTTVPASISGRIGRALVTEGALVGNGEATLLATIEQIDPVGQPFDPERHQAMSMQESADVAPNTVVTVVQKGYLLAGRVVRPAMVIVSRPPAAPESVDTRA